MNTLDDAWRWYSVTRDNLLRMNSLARRYWQQLPWEGELGRNDEFRLLESADVLSETRFSLDFLDDLAVVVLFSVFEATIRSEVKLQVEKELVQLAHPVLRKAADDALWVVNEGSFARVLEPYKAQGHADLIEEANQVRRYRNFVAHGRRGEQPVSITPRAAYDRLTRLLAVVLPGGEESSEQGE
jgi:hypothetical protein